MNIHLGRFRCYAGVTPGLSYWGVRFTRKHPVTRSARLHLNLGPAFCYFIWDAR